MLVCSTVRLTQLQYFVLPLFCGLFPIAPALADDVIFRGKVTLEDGSPPGRAVTIERVCDGLDHTIREAQASLKTGEYFVKLDLGSFGEMFNTSGNLSLLPCHLEAVVPGFTSTRVDLTDSRITRSPRLPTIVMTPGKANDPTGVNLSIGVPHAASRPWQMAIKQLTAKNWAAAETSLHEVVEAAPKFAAGWATLGNVYTTLGKPEDARQALQRAIELNPKPLQPYMALADNQVELRDWQGAVATTGKVLAADSKHDFLQANLLRAIALYQLHDFDGALTEITGAIRLDKQHTLTRAQYVWGVILEARKDYDGSTEHLRNYLEQNPHAKDVATVTTRIANMGKAPIADLATELSSVDLRVATTSETPVPGGIKALSAVAQLRGTLTYQNFFLEYCRAIGEGTPTGSNPTRDAGDAIRAFIATVTELEALGQRQTGSTLIHLSFTSNDEIRKSQNILSVLGWKLLPKGDSFSVEPGDRVDDGFREWSLNALGVDELDLRQAIAAKRDFDFEIPQDNARLVGGAAWGVVLKGIPDMPGGPAAVFIKDWRFARVYSGLGAMEGDSAAAVVSAIGLSNLILKYSTLVSDYGEVLSATDKRVEVPGGAKAQAAWTKLAGAGPQNPTLFLRALFEKDHGRLLGFYFDLAHADAVHRQYFTQTAERAEAYYKWYRDSPAAIGIPVAERWQAKILQRVRIDASGKLILPGGREAWPASSENDDEFLLHRTSLEAVAAIAAMEEKRGTPLTAAAVQLLVQHYPQWHSLFSYFEKLPGLEATEFQALAGFEDDVAKRAADRQNLILGEWHSLVELVVLGTQAGSLNPAQGAQAFRRVCEAMRSENPSAQAIAAAREMAGPGDVDDGLASRLLRLTGVRREAFENVKTMQHVPRIDSLSNPPDAASTLAAFSGLAYAAMLDPAYLLVSEDPGVLSRHIFLSPADTNLFQHSALVTSNGPPGTNFMGGFGGFPEVAHALGRQTIGTLLPEKDVNPANIAEVSPAGATAAPSEAGPSDNLVFRAGGRLVEIYATVTDSRGRYVDNLSTGQFAIQEEGQSKPVFAFENHTTGVSVALVFDTTGSMASALPPLKNAAMQLVENLRPTDSVAVYSFNDKVTELQPFTSDKAAAKRAILKTHAAGITALYDALVHVNHDMAVRTGKKVIIVFTDGSDNASMLTADLAIERAKARGIPIYTIAEGEALVHPQLLAQLANMSESTGGTPFLIRKLSDIGTVFDKVSQDLAHGYLIAFQPEPGNNHVWRKIQLVLSGGPKGLQVRAREGFYVE